MANLLPQAEVIEAFLVAARRDPYISLSITPQAMRSPAAPEGWVS